MLTPVARWSLRHDKEFFTQARRVSSHHFSLYFLPHPTFVAAVIVPKKTLAKATDRNHLKRQLRAILAEKTTSPMRLVVVPHSAATQLVYQELKTALLQVLEKITNDSSSAV